YLVKELQESNSKIPTKNKKTINEEVVVIPQDDSLIAIFQKACDSLN
ncbi:19575_t:CDS:2, partial [Gigaspora margarita]